MLEPKITLKQPASWRNQNVNLLLKVPVGTQFNINSEVGEYLKFYYSWSSENYVAYVMTEEGLKSKQELAQTTKP